MRPKLTEFIVMLREADAKTLLVHDVYEAMSRGKITDAQALVLLREIERRP